MIIILKMFVASIFNIGGQTMNNNFKDVNIKLGLDDKQVIKARQKYGSNQISTKEKEGFLKLLLESLGDPIIKILLIALAIKTIFLFRDFDWFETLGIVIAIFLASFISSISEYGSEKAFIKLQEESSKIKCRVKRNGKIKEINIDEIVIGDIVLLQTGDKIPADGIIVEGSISVDESSLNGEAKEVYKEKTKDINNPFEENKVFRGTVVYANEATMLVTLVGDKTFYGKLAEEIQEKQPDSPLKLRLRHLASIISKMGYIGAFLVAFSYLFSVIIIDNNFDLNQIKNTVTNFHLMFTYFIHALTLCVTIIVVAVPEGLPMMITLVLSSNMKRMLKNNVLVRKLVGIETAGNLNILFTDKTGTLTKGKLEAVNFMSGSLKNYKNEHELLKYPNLHRVLKTSIIYNNSSSYDGKEIIGGNITDRALLGFITSPITYEIKKIKTFPFDSKKKYSYSTIDVGKKVQLIKGAPEIILPNCSYYINEDGRRKILLNKKSINQELINATKKGMRVLAIASKESEHFSLERLTFIGLMFIKDEVRKEAIEGINLVNQAHIQTVMITGDNKDTAIAIGKDIGLLTSDKDIVLTTDELNQKTDEEIKKILPNLKIVARSLPQDKSRLVKISQELGLVVGMTGDGVNDAPALKKADVGFAMGSGTEVSKEASDIVILDDNFLSISKAILFGRTIFKSIRKFIIFQLTINLCAVSLSIIGPFIGIETPVTVIQMLWINMVMDTLAGIAFAYEPPLADYMKEYPKKKDEPIINGYMINEILFTGIYSSILCILFLKIPFIYDLFRVGENDKYFMTGFFGLFIFMGIFNSFNARTHRLNLFAHIFQNKAFIIVILLILVIQLYLIYFGGNLFRTSGLTLFELIIMIMIAFTVIPVDWLRKLYLKKRNLKYGV